VQAKLGQRQRLHARWIYCEDAKKARRVRAKAHDNLALDHSGALVYLAPSRVNLQADAGAMADVTSVRRREHLAAGRVVCCAGDL